MKKLFSFILLVFALLFVGCNIEVETVENNGQNGVADSRPDRNTATENVAIENEKQPTATALPTATPTAKATSTPTVAPTMEASVQALADAKVGDIIDFGSWWFGDFDPIEWIVLAEDENGLLLISRYVLEEMDYIGFGDFEYEDMIRDVVDWETCAVRAYLNDDFYKSAFSRAERTKIKSTKNENKYEIDGITRGGSNTFDFLFCLSLEEAKKYFTVNYWDDVYEYGFSEAAIAEPLPGSNMLCHIMDEDTYTNQYEELGYSRECIGKKGVPWWFRTPVWSGVSYFGCFGDVSYSGAGVRPAMYVSR